MILVGSDFRSPEFLLQMLSNTTAMIPEFGGFESTMEQVLAMTDIIMDQVLRSLEGTVCQEAIASLVV